jgi:uncharacterized protein with FMN-binding domain
MKSTNIYTPRIVGALAIAIVAGAAGYLVFTGGHDKISTAATKQTSSQVTSTPVAATNTQTVTSPTSTTSSPSSTYKDGTYNVTTQYYVPGGGQNSLAVTLTVIGDTITAVQTSNSVQERQSQRYVDSFASNISSSVVGSKLNNAYVGRVGSASLTSSSFNDALDAIMSNAKA